METPLIPFEPHPLFRGGIAQTIVGSKFPGNLFLPERKTHKVKLDAPSGLILYEIPSKNKSRPLVLMAHGMGGCSESGYMRRIANKLWVQGYGVVLMNHRGSGAGMGFSDRLWNGGSSDDLAAVVDFLVKKNPGAELLIAGFSLSGNILLKYLGEGRKLPAQIRGAYAANPPIDLKIACDKISEGDFSRVFNKYYMDLINQQARALLECHPEAFMPGTEHATIREFDKNYTAQSAGFLSAEDYYDACSSKIFLDGIRIPTTILCALDDPFIPRALFDRVGQNPALRYIAPEFGGHMGYLSKNKTPLGDRRWMDYAIVEWVKRMT